MTNLSDQTRKEQVLIYLQDRLDQWVDGTELANERVGGSEGHRRLRELRQDGYPITMRRHPDPDRDIWQYRLEGVQHGDSPSPVSPLRDRPPPGDPVTSLKGLDLSQVQICPRCHGKKRIQDYTKPGNHYTDCPRCYGTGVARR